jgi:O-methyltransferase involved in polyketide biosynthesis
MLLSNVSRTAIYTLVIHDLISKKNITNDPQSIYCLNNLYNISSLDEINQIDKIKKSLSGLGYYNSVLPHIKRITTIDSLTNNFIDRHNNCTVINLACGFDTRFWRINNQDIKYTTIGCSVLDYSWIDKVVKDGNRDFLFIAEGLLMYFPQNDGIDFLSTLPKHFSNSEIVFDMFPKYLTKGIWRVITKWLSKQSFGFDITMDFGFKKTNDLENISSKYRILNCTKIESRSLIHASINS